MPSDWTHRGVIAVPLSLVASGIAQTMGRVFDPDTGGAASFDTVRAGPPGADPTHAICDVLLTTETAALMSQLSAAGPAVLQGYCAQQWAERGFAGEAPSLEDCTAFLAGAQIVTEVRGRELDAVLGETGLSLTPPKPS